MLPRQMTQGSTADGLIDEQSCKGFASPETKQQLLLGASAPRRLLVVSSDLIPSLWRARAPSSRPWPREYNLPYWRRHERDHSRLAQDPDRVQWLCSGSELADRGKILSFKQ